METSGNQCAGELPGMGVARACASATDTALCVARSILGMQLLEGLGVLSRGHSSLNGLSGCLYHQVREDRQRGFINPSYLAPPLQELRRGALLGTPSHLLVRQARCSLSPPTPGLRNVSRRRDVPRRAMEGTIGRSAAVEIPYASLRQAFRNVPGPVVVMGLHQWRH